MARAKKASLTPTPVLDDGFWSRYGLSEDSSTRDKLLWLAFAEISRRGILDVNARWLTDSLGTDPSAINYHFGSFDGLIAEVFVAAHDLWVTTIRDALELPISDPVDRLRAVLDAQVHRSAIYGPVIGLAHLPHVSEQVEEILGRQYPGRLANVVRYAVGVIAVLLMDVHLGQVSAIDFTDRNLPVQETLDAIPHAVKAAASVQWAMVGPTMWMTGKPGGSDALNGIPPEFSAAVIWPEFRDRIIRAALADSAVRA